MNRPENMPDLAAREALALRQRIALQHRAFAALRKALDTATGDRPVIAIAPRLADRPAPVAQPQPVAPSPAWWPALPRPGTPLAPNPGWGAAPLAGRNARVVAVALFGLSGAALERMVNQVADQQAAMGDFVPVFLTDAPETRVFREHGFVFEYFPPALYETQEGPVSTPRAEQRLQLIEQKWGIAALVDLSAPDADAAVLAAGGSPDGG